MKELASAAGMRFSTMLMSSIEAYVAPVWASRGAGERPEEVNHNGTISFVDLGGRKVGITAHHVIAKLRKKQQKNPSAALAINLGSRVTALLQDITIIDEDERRDIAIVLFPDLRLWSGHDKRYFQFRYPIEPARRGEAMTVVGYPGQLRRRQDSLGSFSPHGVGMTVENDPGNNVMLVDVSGTLRTIVERTGSTIPHLNPGGLSGAAGFLWRDSGLHLGGFVYEGDARMLYLVPATILEPDGRIQR